VVYGILCKDEKGFYIKMYKTHWEGGYGIRISKTEFFDEHDRLQNGDIVHLYVGECVVRLFSLET